MLGGTGLLDDVLARYYIFTSVSNIFLVLLCVHAVQIGTLRLLYTLPPRDVLKSLRAPTSPSLLQSQMVPEGI